VAEPETPDQNSDQNPDQNPDQKTDPVANRWWVDSSGKDRKPRPAPVVPTALAGAKFFRAGEGFAQEPARDRLTDNNLKIVKGAAPQEGQWVHVQLNESSVPERERERIKREVALPPYARGVMVDCGRSLRLLVTGTPIGERLLDLTLGDAPSFDCWIRDEWVRETVFKDANFAIRAFKRLVPEYLSPEAIRLAEEIAARA
jgi:hypothetical protein